MSQDLTTAKENFIQGISRITTFWGFPKAMGAMFGTIYLSPAPLSLDEIVEQVGVTKGAVSTNIRNLERLGVVHKIIKMGDRKDYYSAETDFWKIIKGILREREKNEFDRAIKSVGESLDIVRNSIPDPGEKELTLFYEDRLKTLNQFFESLDKLVATIIAVDDMRSGVLGKFGK
ncbi:MAG: hypothetical protein KKE17_07785 [Proteobacteria bacterium]|nr:hypothetical protein [Pseudomonadota bacterium]MBU1709887.1 hypothetical protein [Pseudomonadota bacterium]